MKGLHPADRQRRRPKSVAEKIALANARRFPNGTAQSRHENAYRGGRELATRLLQSVVAMNNSDVPWNPEHGPDPSWSFARGILDVLLPAFESTTQLMGRKAGRQFALALRQGLLDDFRYHAEAALERAQQPYHFLPYSEEW